MRAVNAIRELLMKSVQEAGDVPILLSGGVDSGSVLAAALALGRKPVCFTFKTSRVESEDFLIAQEMCDRYSLSHVVVTVPVDEASVLADVKGMLPFIVKHGRKQLPEAHVIYKVWVEVLRPMMYVTNTVRGYGFKKALTGFCADAYYGSGVAASKMLQYEGFDAWHAYRVKFVQHPLNADEVVRSWAETKGLTLHDCWLQQPLQDHMLSLGPTELHKPRTKWCAIEAFPEFWLPTMNKNRVFAKWYRENSSLQVNSGVREDHACLLENPAINLRERKAVIALYYDLAESLGLDPRGLERMSRHGDGLFS